MCSTNLLTYLHLRHPEQLVDITSSTGTDRLVPVKDLCCEPKRTDRQLEVKSSVSGREQTSSWGYITTRRLHSKTGMVMIWQTVVIVTSRLSFSIA